MVAALCIILVASVPLMVYAMVLEQVNASLKSEENRRLHASLLESRRRAAPAQRRAPLPVRYNSPTPTPKKHLSPRIH